MPVRSRRQGVARLEDLWRAKRVYCLAALMLSASVRILDAGDVLAQSAPSQPVNMDLSSTHPSMQAPNATAVNIVTGGTVQNGTITGGVAQAIAPGQLITPAQYLAVTGAMKGGQTLQVNAPGQATGGYANLSSVVSPQLNSVVVPQNVSLSTIGFNAATPLNVMGSINILGSMYALQTSLNVASVLHSGDLNVGPGGLLSGLLPSGINLGPGVFASGGMQIVTANNVSNLGTIVTPGSLSITAGGSINNQNTTNSSALMSAQNINLVTGAGQVVNSGIVQAANNININTMDKLTNLNVNSTAGTFEAISGAINVRDASYDGAANTNLTGGNWLSKELNLNCGQGTVDVIVGDVTGTINANAEAAHVLASTPKLALGNMKIDGDPTYVNTGGDIQIVGTVSENEDLAIIASGNITTSGAARIINHGHDVWLIAGASINTANGACVGCGSNPSGSTLPPGTTSPITSGYVQVSAGGATFGSIDMQTGNTLSTGSVIDTSSNVAGKAGGNVFLVAFRNNFSQGGRILFPTTAGVTSIETSGNAAGANGNVTILAGAAEGTGVSVGRVIANGGSGGGGSVQIRSAQAAFSGGAGSCSSCMSFGSTGKATGGINTPAITFSDIIATGPIDAASSILVSGGTAAIMEVQGSTIIVSSVPANGNTGNITVGGDLISKSGNLNLTVSGNGNIIQTSGTLGASGNLFIQTNSGDIEIANDVTTSGEFQAIIGNGGTGKGTISVKSIKAGSLIGLAATGIVSIDGSLDVSGGKANGFGGQISLDATALNFTAPNPILNADGKSNGNGGVISFGAPVSITGGGPLRLSVNGSGTGNGGSVYLSGKDMVVDNTPGAISISATGGSSNSASGNGGQLALFISNNLTVNGSAINLRPQGTNGNGGILEFKVGNSGAGNLTVAGGSIDCSGVGSGKGGMMTISAVTKSSININTLSPGDLGTGPADSNDGFLAANGGANGGKGGYLLISNTGGGGIEFHSYSVSADGDGGSLNFDVFPGTIKLGLATVSTSALDFGTAGALTIIADQVIVTNGNNVALKANASGTGFGGSILVKANSPTLGDLTIGNGAGAISVHANGGSIGADIPYPVHGGGAGSIRAIVGHNLFVDTSGLYMRPLGNNGNGPSYTFAAGTAGSGNLEIVGPLISNGVGVGKAWRIEVTANTSVPLTINTYANGDGGTISANGGPLGSNGSNLLGNGGIITIQNLGSGGVDITTKAITADAVIGMGGAITLESKGHLQLNLGGISASALSSGKGGTVSILSQTLGFLPTESFSLVANGAGTEYGGLGGAITVSVTDSLQGNILIGDEDGALNFSVTAPIASNYGTVDLIAGKNIDTVGSALFPSIVAKSLSLTAGGTIGAGGNLLTEVSSIIAKSVGDIRLENTIALGLTARSTSGNVFVTNTGNVSLQDSGSFTNLASKSFAVDTKADGNGEGKIFIAGNVAATSVVLHSTSSGTGLGGIQGGGILTGNTINLIDSGVGSAAFSQNIGSLAVPISSKSSNISLSSDSGSIWLSNAGAASLSVLAGANLSMKNSGNLTLQGSSKVSGSFTVSTSTDGSGSGRIIIAGDIEADTIQLSSASFGNGAGGIQNGAGTGTLTATAVTLVDSGTSSSAGAKDIGSMLSPIALQTGAITAQTNGSIFLTNKGTASLNTNAKGNVQLTNTGNITLGTNTTAGAFELVTMADGGGNGRILIGAAISAGSISLSSSSTGIGNGGIQKTGAGGSLAASKISLIDTGTSSLPNAQAIGSLGSRITTQTADLAASANGGVWLSNAGSIASLSSSSSGSFNLSNNNSVIIGPAGINSTGDVSISSTTNNGSIDASKGSIIVGGNLSLSTSGSGTVSVGAGKTISASNSIDITSAGITLDGTVASSTVTMKPNNGSASIGINGGAGSFQFSGAMLGQIVANTVEIGSKSGTGPVELSSPGASFTPTYSLSIVGSNAGTNTFKNNGTLSIGTNNLSVVVGGAITSGNISGDDSAVVLQGSSVTINNDIQLGASSSASLQAKGASGSGSISGVGKLVATNLLLSSSNDFIAASSTTPLLTSASSVSFSAAGRVEIQNNGDLQIGASNGNSIGLKSNGSIDVVGNVSSTNSVVLNCDQISISSGSLLQGSTISLSGQSSNGSFSINTNLELENSGTIQATVGNIVIASAPGQDMRITGDNNGKFIVPTGGTISITATANPSVRNPSIILGPGDQSFIVGNGSSPGGAVAFTATGGPTSSVTIEPTVSYDFPRNYTNVTLFAGTLLGDPSQLAVHTVSHPNPNSTLKVVSTIQGTIANSNGQIDLSQIDNLVFVGPLAILAATDIIYSGSDAIKIDLHSTVGAGGNLVLISGFDFTPGTIGTVGPNNIEYTLFNPTGATRGGSIDIAALAIDTHGVSDGGSVLVVANKGTEGSGYINIGSINSKGGSGSGGSITLIGSGIKVSSINTGANDLNQSGPVFLNSVESIALSGNTRVMDGEVVTGGFIPGSGAGVIEIANSGINAGASKIEALGGQIIGNGVLAAGNIVLTASTGSIGPLSTAVSNILADAAGVITINNNGVLNSLSSVTSAGFSLFCNDEINIGTTGISSAGAISLSTTGNSGSINLKQGSINAGEQISFSTDGGGIVFVAAGKTAATQGDNVLVQASGARLLGALNAGTGNVYLIPNDDSASIGINGGAGKMQINGLQQISANTITVGSSLGTGAINVNAAGSQQDVNSNLVIFSSKTASSATFENSGILSTGNHSLTVLVGGAITSGQIDGSGNSVSLTGSSINIDGIMNLDGSASATLRSTTGSVTGLGSINAADLTLISDNSSIGSGSLPLSTNAKSISASAAGIINIQNSGSPVSVVSKTSAGFVLSNNNDISILTVDTSGAVSISGPGKTTVVDSINALGSIQFTTSKLELPSASATISGASVFVDGVSGFPLILGNAGTIVANTGNLAVYSAAGQALTVGVPGQTGAVIAKAGSVSLVAIDNGSSSSINFVGNQSFAGSTFLGASGVAQSVNVDAGVSVVGYDLLLVESSQLNLSGSISGNPLVLSAKGAGTIANSNPAVALDLKNLGNLSFAGSNLTILSAGSIINSGANLSIDLSGTNSGSSLLQSGSLNLIAGFNFTGATSSPALPPSSGTYQLSSSNPGKNVDLSRVSITSSSNFTGGNVLVVATGAVKLGTINVSAGAIEGIGGSVSVLGNGITAGNINTSANSSGSVSIQSGTPVISGGSLSIVNGTLSGDGTFVSASLAGNVAVSNISAGNGDVTISTGAAGTITQKSGTTITVDGLLDVSSGSKGFNLRTAAVNVSLHTLPSSAANVSITSSVLATLLSSTIGGNLSVTSSAGLRVGKGETIASNGSVAFINKNVIANLELMDGSVLQAGKDITLSSSSGISAGNGAISSTGAIFAKSSGYLQFLGTSIDSPKSINLTGTTGVSIDQGASISAGVGLSVTATDAYANLTVGNNVTLSAGSLNGAPAANGVLNPIDIASKGAIVFSAGSSIGVGSNSIWTANGGDIKVTAKGVAGTAIGNLGMGTNNQFIANGGNIIILARGVVYGNDGNYFHARAVGTKPADSKGGGIEIGSGLTSSTSLNSAFSQPKNSSPPASALGQNVLYSGNIGGVLKANLSGGGAVNLNWTNLNPSVLNLNGNATTGGGGAQVFDAKGSGAQVLFDHASFQTEAFKPIAMITKLELDQATDPLRLKKNVLGETEINVGNMCAELSVVLVEASEVVVPKRDTAFLGGRVKANIVAGANTTLLSKGDTLHLKNGEVFLDACSNVRVYAGSARVLLKKGGLASILSENGCTHVRVCSANGTVLISIGGKHLDLHSGEEILIADHEPRPSDLRPIDGIGRRPAWQGTIGAKHIAISDFSIPSMLANSSVISKNLRNSSNKFVVARMLKTAATIEIMFKHRGPYWANTR